MWCFTLANTDEQNIELLKEARDNVIVLIGQLTAQPKPNYDIDGQRIDWADYLDMLMKRRNDLNQDIIDLEGPYEIETQGYL